MSATDPVSKECNTFYRIEIYDLIIRAPTEEIAIREGQQVINDGRTSMNPDVEAELVAEADLDADNDYRIFGEAPPEKAPYLCECPGCDTVIPVGEEVRLEDGETILCRTCADKLNPPVERVEA